MQNLAPIALFVYNRPEHTRRTIKFLQQNFLAQESRLFVFSDAPGKKVDEERVAQVRELIKEIAGFKSVDVIERDENWGLANSIIDGVTRLTNEYGKVIVFEDDLISSPHTLQYFNDALKKYETQSRVMHIGAYMYPLSTAGLPEAFFSRIVTSWGWATWKRAWDYFNPDINLLIRQFDKQKIREFSFDHSMNFWKQMQEFKSGKNNSWAIRWYASVFLQSGLSLNPSRSLINNIGHDGSGVHSGRNDIFNVVVNADPVLSFPETIAEDTTAYHAIRNFLKHRKGTLLQRIIRLLRQKFYS